MIVTNHGGDDGVTKFHHEGAEIHYRETLVSCRKEVWSNCSEGGYLVGGEVISVSMDK